MYTNTVCLQSTPVMWENGSMPVCSHSKPHGEDEQSSIHYEKAACLELR